MLTLLRREPVLREATVSGMLLFGALSAFWADLSFLLEGPAYGYGPAAAGLFGLVGAASALVAPLAGRLSDARDPRALVGRAALGMLAGYAVLALFGLRLWGVVAGVVLLDVASQSAAVANQASVYSLRPEAHSRLYTVYRAAFSLGGSAGAYLGAYGWSIAGWGGVCAIGAGLVGLALFLPRAAAGARVGDDGTPPGGGTAGAPR
jgi:predicted MFS family arabinose efflux permease